MEFTLSEVEWEESLVHSYNHTACSYFVVNHSVKNDAEAEGRFYLPSASYIKAKLTGLYNRSSRAGHPSV
jgi:hypothetical protein